MRNVVVTSSARRGTALGGGNRCEALAVDPTSSRLFLASSSSSKLDDDVEGGDLEQSPLVDIDIWQVDAQEQMHRLSSFAAPRAPRFAPRIRAEGRAGWVALEEQTRNEVVSLDYLADGGEYVAGSPAVCVVTAGGDIGLVAISEDIEHSPETILPEIVGSVQQGILAAAWSPDEELLVLVTDTTPADMTDDGIEKGPSLLVMTREFEVLSEAVVRTDDFGEERPIALGWGSKATQFHGSAGKQAAQEGITSDADDDSRGPAVPDDDGLPHISWRGDASIFVISTLEASRPGRISADSRHHRIMRTYSKTGNLLATSEPTSRGVSHALAFKPSGILMATTQRYGTDFAEPIKGTEEGSHTVSFFERNGLPKGHFILQHRGCETIVRGLAWNSDGSLLSVWLRERKGASQADTLQLWSVNNYHWYLKQEFTYLATLATVRWHPENRHELFVAQRSGEIERQTYVLGTSISSAQASCAAVVDGRRLLLTPFRFQNIPPPMASITLDLPAVPVSTSWCDVDRTSILSALFPLGRVQLWALTWTKGGALPTPSLWADIQTSTDLHARQVVAMAKREDETSLEMHIALLGSQDGQSDIVKLVQLRICEAEIRSQEEVKISSASQMLSNTKSILAADHIASSFATHTADGRLAQFGSGETDAVSLASLNHFCPWLKLVRWKGAENEHLAAVGLTENGVLMANDKTLARDATSFVVTKTHVIWTTTAHEAKFLPVASLDDPTVAPQTETLSRRVERGSRIVCAVPALMSLILQMPRGNLETICPRPLVLARVRFDLDSRRYRRALTTCRTHRIDLNLLYDHDGDALLANMDSFVDLVDNAEYLELFLSNLRDEDVTSTLYPTGPAVKKEKVVRAGKVNRICDSIRSVLEAKLGRGNQYINTILTTFVRKTPPDNEGALALLKELKKQDTSLADEACKFVIFLTDADRLFDAALGTYDFTLPLLVAQHSPRRDPREYLPLLRELRSVQPLERQRFRIDDHLQRRAKALSWLLTGAYKHESTDTFLSDALEYMRRHVLYWDAIEFISRNATEGQDSDVAMTVQLHCAEWLLSQAKEYEQAAILFCNVRKWNKAIEAYIAAGQWRLAMTLASSQSKTTVDSVARRAIEQLRADQKYNEAAALSLEYLSNEVDDAVDLLLLARNWAEAARCAASRGRGDLIQTVIWPAASEVATELIEEVQNDVAVQFDKQINRLAELRQKKREQPQDFYPAGYNDADDNSASVLTGTSAGGSAFSTFTRYTAIASTFSASLSDAPSSSSAGGGSASVRKKLKKKEERAKHTGKKGSIYEEDYLFTSLAKLVGEHRWGRITGEASALVVCLAFASNTASSAKYAKAAKDLQSSLEAFEATATTKLVELNKAVAAEEEQLESDRLEAIEQAFELGLSPDEMKRKRLFAPLVSRKPTFLFPSTGEASSTGKMESSWKVESLDLVL